MDALEIGVLVGEAAVGEAVGLAGEKTIEGWPVDGTMDCSAVGFSVEAVGANVGSVEGIRVVGSEAGVEVGAEFGSLEGRRDVGTEEGLTEGENVAGTFVGS